MTIYSLNKEYLSWNWKNVQSWHKQAVFKQEQKTEDTQLDTTELKTLYNLSDLKPKRS